MARKHKKTPARVSNVSSPSIKSAGTLWGKLVESTLTYIVTFVLGTALVSGCKYIILNAEADKLALDREILLYGASTREDQSASEMAGLWNSSGSSKTESLTKLGEVVKRLSSGVAEARIDDTFVRETSIWASESISRITSLIGSINGYTFRDELTKNLQHDYVRELEAEKTLLSEVTDIVNVWNQLSVERRRDRLGQIFNKGLEVKTGIAQIESRSLQVLKKIAEKSAENRQKYNELKNQDVILTRKKQLAKLGIAIGIGLILLAIVGYIIQRKR